MKKFLITSTAIQPFLVDADNKAAALSAAQSNLRSSGFAGSFTLRAREINESSLITVYASPFEKTCLIARKLFNDVYSEEQQTQMRIFKLR